MQYRAVLFDFDFTLADASEAILAGFQHGFSTMGLPDPDPDAVRRTIGIPLEDAFTLLTGHKDEEERQHFRALFTEVAAPMQVEVTRLFPGAEELLRALQAAGIPAALVSTKRAQTLRQVLAPRGLLGMTARQLSSYGGSLETAVTDLEHYRRSGSAALDLCDVACGRMDAYVERFLYPWDYAAGSLIVTEAGGYVSTMAGGPLTVTGRCSVWASNDVNKDVLKELAV